MRYWLMKSEPDTFSIDDLKKEKVTAWEGVRSYGARNHMVAMSVGDLVLFYHSSCKPAGVVGVAKVVAKAHADKTQFDASSSYYAPKATEVKPIWYCADVRFVKKLNTLFTLETIKQDPRLAGLYKRVAARLSVLPITQEEFEYITSAVN